MNTLHFDSEVLHSVAGGQSVIDSPKLHISSLAAAESFISNYGYDLSSATDIEELWQFHRRALVLMCDRLGFCESEIPEELRDPKVLKDLRQLLLWASLPSEDAEANKRQRWACAILRCIHVFVHSENDLFGSFSEDIQKQILSPLEEAVVHSGQGEVVQLVGKNSGDRIPLAGFQVKPFKTSSSSVIKMLAKPDAVAMKIFDKLGVRFVTKSIFDSFRVIRFLVQENLISFPHIMPDQSSNTIYPVDLFLRMCQQIKLGNCEFSDSELESLFAQELERTSDLKFLRKHNDFSAQDYQFMKFISRKLIKIEREGREAFAFFYPFEVQIMDQKSFAKAASGPSEHEAYKERQRIAARRRLFPQDADGMIDELKRMNF